jgi:hypothetical protein
MKIYKKRERQERALSRWEAFKAKYVGAEAKSYFKSHLDYIDGQIQILKQKLGMEWKLS